MTTRADPRPARTEAAYAHLALVEAVDQGMVTGQGLTSALSGRGSGGGQPRRS